jgi:hypothetical protein
MLCDDLIRVATLARNRKSYTGVAATKGRHLGRARVANEHSPAACLGSGASQLRPGLTHIGSGLC